MSINNLMVLIIDVVAVGDVYILTSDPAELIVACIFYKHLPLR